MPPNIAQHRWIPELPRNAAARLRLFCFPHAGGSPAVFRELAAHLPREIQCCPVQYPGQWDPDARFRRAGALADAAFEGLWPELRTPFALFGYSMGALAAFELAQRVAAAGGAGASHLFTASQAAPHLPRVVPDLHQLADELFLERVQERYGPIAPEVLREPDLVRYLLPVLRSDMEVVETYRYREQPRLPCGITAMAGERDVSLTPEGVAAWGMHTEADFAVRWFPARHFVFETHAPEIAREIAAVLL